MHRRMFGRWMMPLMDANGGGTGGGTGGTGGDPGSGSGGTGGQGGSQNQNPPAIDYEKLAGIISGKQQLAEDKVLKGYFEQQGLTGDEMKQAIASFKEQKAKNQPDVAALQQQLAQSQAIARQATIDKEATTAALGLGIDAKTVPYVLKLADMSKVMKDDGSINAEEMQNALKKVLEDVPALKPTAGTGGTGGFQQVGAGGNGGSGSTEQEAELDRIFGVSRK